MSPDEVVCNLVMQSVEEALAQPTKETLLQCMAAVRAPMRSVLKGTGKQARRIEPFLSKLELLLVAHKEGAPTPSASSPMGEWLRTAHRGFMSAWALLVVDRLKARGIWPKPRPGGHKHPAKGKRLLTLEDEVAIPGLVMRWVKEALAQPTTEQAVAHLRGLRRPLSDDAGAQRVARCGLFITRMEQLVAAHRTSPGIRPESTTPLGKW